MPVSAEYLAYCKAMLDRAERDLREAEARRWEACLLYSTMLKDYEAAREV